MVTLFKEMIVRAIVIGINLTTICGKRRKAVSKKGG